MPLKGLKILDFTALLPGPLATMQMADLGACVLKIESKSRPDLVRFIPPFIDEKNEISCVHAYLNRNKKSLSLDIRKDQAIQIVERLIIEKGYDIIIEQFRPGVMEKFGLSYDRLKNIKKSLIYCSITGYGQFGPNIHKAGHDINYLSLSGIMSFSGSKITGPSKLGIQVADTAGANSAVTAVLAAVIHRMNTGKGQHIDISMTDVMFPYTALSSPGILLNGEKTGQEPSFETEVLNGGSLYGFYKTKDERYLSFGGLEPQFSETFFRTLGLADMISGGIFQFNCLEEAKKRVSDVISSMPLSHWIEAFSGVDACVEPVLTLDEALESSQVSERCLCVEVPCQNKEKNLQIACPIKFSESVPKYRHTGRCIGEDDENILSELGYKASEIKDLKDKGVFG